MKKILRATFKFLRPAFILIGKGIAHVAFVWRMFSYEIRFTTYREGSQGHNIKYRKIPRWYSPFFWIGLVVWALLSAIGAMIEAWFELTNTKRELTFGDYFSEEERVMTETDDRRTSLEEWALKNIYSGKTTIL